MTRACIAASLLLAVAARAQIVFVPPVVPPGFAVDILTETLSEPTGLAILPDGRILVCEQRTGAIKIWTGSGFATTVGTIAGVNAGAYERGLLAIAIDPQWPARPYLYAWYCAAGVSQMRLSMFTMLGDLAIPTSSNLSLGPQYDVLNDVPDQAAIHNGGSLRFGPDGMLYVSVGDDGNPCAAQDPNSLLGCVLRLNVAAMPGPGPGPPQKSVLVPPGNPFAGPTVNAQLVWSFGLRNPFRFHVDPLGGGLMIADVGAYLVDEVDASTTGGENFGWPWYEANLNGVACAGAAPQTVQPVSLLPHTNFSASTTAIMSFGRYRNAPNGVHNLGVAYDGDYFFSEYFTGAVRRLRFNGTAWIPAPPVAGQPNPTDWAAGFQSVVDTAIGADGAIYFVKQFSANLHGALGRIRSDPTGTVLSSVSGNHQPGNAGRALEHPLAVRLTTPGGAAVAGAPVTFVAALGGGSVNPATAITDTHGIAATVYTLPAAYTLAPAIAATATGSSYVVFDAVWRGLKVANSLTGPVISVEVRHSETTSPFTLAWGAPVASPLGYTPFGDLWLDVTNPASLGGWLDGLGLFGPPDPAFKTGATAPLWTMSAAVPPVGSGTQLLFQAFAIDSTLAPAPESIMISNPQVVTIP
jgi:glucose/arabinose dehydrogenase